LTAVRTSSRAIKPPLADLHEDISLYYVLGGYGLKFKVADFSVDLEARHADIPKYKKANAKLVFSSIAPLTPTLSQMRIEQQTKGYGGYYGAMKPRAPTLVALEHISSYLNLVRKHRDSLRFVMSREDVESLKHDAKIGFLVALEGSEPLEDVEDIELFYRLGVRSLQLLWNFDNKFAASCMSKKDYGLTGDGENLVQLCNEMGIIVDLSHASKKTTMETLSISSLPAIISHANAKAVREHARNVDDEELEALKKNRGTIGVTLIAPTLSPGIPSVREVADNIMYIYERFGGELISIGTDYFGLLNVDEPHGLEDITKFGNLWDELLNRGLKETDIGRIAFDNALRVVKANAERWR